MSLVSLAREIALQCDARGVVTWADERAAFRLGPCVGSALASFAVPGTSSKIDRFVAAARSGPTADWEVGLVVGGAPVTLAMRGEPEGDGIVVVASFVPEDQAGKLASVQASLSEIGALHRETERQRRELADANKGLLSLHHELDDKNIQLRHASDVKSRVVANVSHELKTPINAILGITRLLLDRLDGDLTGEQEKQLGFVRSSAESLGLLVDDLLDLSRLEAGKHPLRTSRFTVADLLASLRGTMRPLATNPAVSLVVEDAPADLPALDTDEGKVAQVLRNLVSNALKFTERGEVRVRASHGGAGRVAFSVGDTGIGIAPEDQPRVFEEFTQLDGPMQRKVRGTGLGLTLSRKLAELLGGSLEVESEVGAGSTFTLTVPAVHADVEEMRAIEEKSTVLDPMRAPVLVIEDDRQTLFFYERYLSKCGFQVLPARTLDDARRAMDKVIPAAVVLDVLLEGESTWRFLAELKDDPRTADVPVMVVTVIDQGQKARALGADEFWLKPIDGSRLVRKVSDLAKRDRGVKVLVVDDDPASRYLLVRLLDGTGWSVLETGDGAEAVRLARAHAPGLILLDFVLGDATAFDVLDDLKADPSTRSIPVIVQTAKQLDESERERLARETSAILQKQTLSRELAISRIREALVGAGLRSGATEPARRT